MPRGPKERTGERARKVAKAPPQATPEPVAVPIDPIAPAQEAPERNLTAERDTEVIPAARELLARMVVRADLMMGSNQTVNAESMAPYYQKLYVEDVVPMLLARNLKIDDVSYLFSLMLQPIQLLKDVTLESFKLNEELANAKKWGVKDTADLRVVDLDTALRSPEVSGEKDSAAAR